MKLAYRVVLAACAAALVSAPASAQWAWRDASGKMVFSDQAPPKSVPAKDILRRPHAATAPSYGPAPDAAPKDDAKSAGEPAKGAAKAAPSLAEREIESRRRQQERAEAQKKAAEEEQRKAQLAEDCERLRRYQKALDEGQRLARLNAAGEREVLDDSMRADESQRTRAYLEQHCR